MVRLPATDPVTTSVRAPITPVTMKLSAAELAGRTGTSDATVVRTVQALGFTGLPELKRAAE